MSEIKITKDSLENAILKDGNFVSGVVVDANKKIDASGNGAHAEGYGNIIANGDGAHAEGLSTSAVGNGAHAEGCLTISSSTGSHAEGYNTQAFANYSHAEGNLVNANAIGSHAEGYNTNTGLIDFLSTIYNSYNGTFKQFTILGNAKHTFNRGDIIKISNTELLIEDVATSKLPYVTTISTINGSDDSIPQLPIFKKTVSGGEYAHAEGKDTLALANYSHAGGIGTIANQEAMTVIGKYNTTNTENTLFVVGDGTSSADTDRSDAFRVVSNGSSTTSPSSVQAKVNGVSDVYLGCPIGTIVMWAGRVDPTQESYPPDGWLLCDGSTLNNSDGKYNNLYGIIGNKYGGTDETSFNLPDLRQRFPLGAQDGGKIGQNNKLAISISRVGLNAFRYYTIQELAVNDTIDMLNHYDENTYSEYFKIVSLGGWNGLYYTSINVKQCTKDGTVMTEVQQVALWLVLDTIAFNHITLGGTIDVVVYTLNFSTSFGAIGGESEHTLSIIEMPSHNHNLNRLSNDDSNYFTYSSTGGTYDNNVGSIDTMQENGVLNNVSGTNNYTNNTKGNYMQLITNTGSNAPHNNIPPYLAINFIIKYK